ncbi:glycoside hydrolase family 5 protein [Anaerolineae bacterium CFX8]|nr:glycoside hydrolase family 5 protein [Anaerolineae bacterium CFX8]
MFFRLAVITLALGGLAAVGVSAQESGVSDARFARLARGTNLPFWFWYAPETPEEIEARYSDADFTLTRAMGFTYARVPVDMGFLLDESRPDLLNRQRLALFDSGLDRLLAHGLAVMVDLHSTSLEDSNNSNYSASLEDPAFVDTFVQFWRSFAAHLSARDPEWVFLELMNEPVFYDSPELWPPIQARTLAAVRESAPEHTIILTGARWSNVDTFIELTPTDDTNIIYNFHFYEPHPFTHQGADWSDDSVMPLRNVPYPADPQAVQALVDSAESETVRETLRAYGEEYWDAAKIAERIQLAADWGARHNVRLICNEFGVFSPYAPPDDRAQWIEDVRTNLERHGIGWAVWEFDGSFGVVARAESDEAVVDAAVARALGLTLP